jgi:ferrous iron transport protein A
VLQLIFNKQAVPSGRTPRSSPRSLGDLERGEHGILDRLELPEDAARRLMELGFVPGARVAAAHAAPGGDPRVFRIGGSEIALRRETSTRLYLRAGAAPDPSIPR